MPARALLPVILILPLFALANTPVRVTEAVAGRITEQVPVTGTVTSARSAMLSVSVEGLVESVALDAGARVEAGDVVLRLDAELQQARYDSSRAAVQEAEARLADARRRQAEASTLRGAIPASEIRSLEAEVEIAAAAAARLEAEARQQRALLRRHAVQAPFAGVISEKLVEVGEWVAPGDAVLALVDTDALRIDFPVPQEYAGRLDDQVNVLLGAGDGVRAEVIASVPVNDPTARTFLMRTAVPQELALLPGMSVRARLRLPAAQEQVLVPRDALVRYPDGRVSVWLVVAEEGDTVARERFVRTGATRDSQAAVLEGLAAGQQVVVRGNEALRDGMILTVQGE